MAAFINGLMKMSVRGIVIILIVLCVRLLLKKMKISHKYIVGLWIMAFLFFIVPWKISLPVGFWGNTAVLDGIWMDAGSEKGTDGNFSGTGNAGYTGYLNNANDLNNDGNVDDSGNIGNISNMSDNGLVGNISNMSDNNHIGNVGNMSGSGPVGNVSNMNSSDSGNPVGNDGYISSAGSREYMGKMWNEDMTVPASLWLAGLFILSGHMLYSYLLLRRRLMLSIPYRDNIRWAENIDMPIVFGPVRPQIYLPVTLETENLSCIIAHEEMHIRRRDGLLKMAAYVICLLHWFNPFIWVAYILLGSDLEKACDEEVIRSMGKEKRKEYAYALIRIASGKGKRKRQVFVAPIGFAEGNLKSRVKNVMKYKYTLPGLGAVVMAVIIALFMLFMTEAKEPAESQKTGNLTGENEGQGDSGGLAGNSGEQGDPGGLAGNNGEQGDLGGLAGNNGTQGSLNTDTAYNEDELPVFCVEDLDSLDLIKGKTGDSLSIEDCYITNRRIVSNHYFIDESGVLWGTGRNDYGQLGTGTYSIEEYHEEPVKIAEHVVSVDVSENAYFCIYLTESGELYGVGLNYAGLLLGKGSETVTYNAESYHRVAEPVLLMTDVAYARAGRTCIVVLQRDGSAYWWGEYSSTTLSHGGSREDYWKLEEDDANPAKMFAGEPKKIMDDCIYITTGTYAGAAINEAGELYTWGLNLFGQCGAPVTGDDYIRKPVKVMDNVKMVWVGRIIFGNNEDKFTDYVGRSTYYRYNTFILKEDNALMAVGLNLGDQEQVTELTGDLWETCIHQYGDSFVPVQAVEYSAELNLQVLRKLEFGMSIEEAEGILNSSGPGVFRSDVEGIHLCAKESQYMCYFDSQNRLESILIQEGGSRDGRFLEGMSLSELRAAVELAGGELTEGTDGDYFYEDGEQRIKYSFHIYDNSLINLWEIAMD